MLFNVLTLPVTMIPNLIYNDSGDSMFPHGEGFGQLWCGTLPSLSAPSHLRFVSPGPCAGLSACVFWLSADGVWALCRDHQENAFDCFFERPGTDGSAAIA